MGKKQFLRHFGQFIADNISDLEIDKIEYVITDDGNEYAYICYLNQSQKRIDITASSNIAIIQDIINNIEKTEYLLPSQRINFYENN